MRESRGQSVRTGVLRGAPAMMKDCGLAGGDSLENANKYCKDALRSRRQPCRCMQARFRPHVRTSRHVYRHNSPRTRCCATTTDDNIRFEALRSWVHARGGRVHPALRLTRTDTGGRELRVSSPVEAGVVLTHIPTACCLHTPLAGAAPWPARVAIELLRIAEDAEYRAVVDLWPPQVVPVLSLASWSVLEVLAHALPDVIDAACNCQLELMSFKPDDCASPERWKWALSLSLSRTCCPDGGPGHVLAPVFDLANHDTSGDAPCEWAWCEETSALQIRTARALDVGDAARISYGQHGNAALALSYGFVVADNADDSMPLFNTCDVAGRHGAVSGELLDTLAAQHGGAEDAVRAAVHGRAEELLRECRRNMTDLSELSLAGGQQHSELTVALLLLKARHTLLQELLHACLL
jgi:hypothetical protein